MCFLEIQVHWNIPPSGACLACPRPFLHDIEWPGQSPGVRQGLVLPCLLETKLHPLVLVFCGNNAKGSLFPVLLQKDTWIMYFSLSLSVYDYLNKQGIQFSKWQFHNYITVNISMKNVGNSILILETFYHKILCNSNIKYKLEIFRLYFSRHQTLLTFILPF